MSLRKEGANAIVWSLIEKFMKRGVQFVLSIFLARLLNPSDFGIVAMASIFVSWAEVFSDFGMGQAIIQKKDVTEIQTSTVFWINLMMGVLIALVFLIIAPWAAKFYGVPMVAWVIRIAGLTFIIHALNVVQSSLFKKALNFKVATIASVLSSTLSGVFGIVLAYLGFGVWALLIQSVLSATITTSYFWFKSTWRPTIIFNFKETMPLFKKGFGFMGQGLVDNVFSSLGSIAIGKLFSPSMLGLFSRGNDLAAIPETTVISPIARPLFPIFAKIQDKKEDIKHYYLKTLEMLNWSMIMICGILLLCSREIIILLYGNKWSESSIFLFILAFKIPFVPKWNTTTALWKATGHVKKIVLVTFIEKLLFFLSLVALFYDIKLYAISLVVSYFISVIIQAIMNASIIGVSIWKQYREWMINMSIMIIEVVALSQIKIQYNILSILVKGIIFLVVYLFVSKILKLKGMNNMTNELRGLIRRYKK